MRTELLRAFSFYNPRRISNNYSIVRNIFNHHSPGSNRHIIANGDVANNGYMATARHIVSYSWSFPVFLTNGSAMNATEVITYLVCIEDSRLWMRKL